MSTLVDCNQKGRADEYRSFRQSVLESVGGDQDRAVDMLLGMSDPEYVSQAAPAPVQVSLPSPHISVVIIHKQSQTDLDEEFARRLAFEEESRHQHEQNQQQSWQPSGGNDGSMLYQTRDQSGGRQQQQQQGDGQKDSMAEFQDQFSKIADSKSLHTIVYRVNADCAHSWEENFQSFIHKGQS